MSNNEKIVRQAWKYVKSWVRDLDSYGTDQFNVAIFLNEKDADWEENPYKRWQADVGEEKKVWREAAEFTKKRLDEIKLLEEFLLEKNIGMNNIPIKLKD